MKFFRDVVWVVLSQCLSLDSIVSEGIEWSFFRDAVWVVPSQCISLDSVVSEGIE